MQGGKSLEGGRKRKVNTDNIFYRCLVTRRCWESGRKRGVRKGGQRESARKRRDTRFTQDTPCRPTMGSLEKKAINEKKEVGSFNNVWERRRLLRKKLEGKKSLRTSGKKGARQGGITQGGMESKTQTVTNLGVGRLRLH